MNSWKRAYGFMSGKDVYFKNKVVLSVCSCECHENSDVRHIVACCDLCYKQFKVDGKIDKVLLEVALEEAYDWHTERAESLDKD